jgi:hypothetical protein
MSRNVLGFLGRKARRCKARNRLELCRRPLKAGQLKRNRPDSHNNESNDKHYKKQCQIHIALCFFQDLHNIVFMPQSSLGL